MKKIVLIALLIVLTTLFFVTPVLASYYANLRVVESDGNDYTGLALVYDLDIDYLIDNNYITSTGLDTRVATASGTALPHMVADDKVLFVSDIGANTQTNLLFTTGDTALDSFPIVVGYGGYVTIPDATTPEPGNNFEIETSGYVATDAVGEYLVHKEGAFRTYISAASSVTSDILTTTTPAAIYNVASGNYDDGYLDTQDTSYATAHNQASADTIDMNTNHAYIGQDWNDPTYKIDRAYFYFDTSGIPDDANVISAVLSFYDYHDDSTTDFDIVVTSGMPDYPTAPLAVGSYNYTLYLGNYGSLNTADYVAGYNDITLTDAGEALINLTGYSKFCLMSSLDIAATAPTGDEFVQVCTAEYTGTDHDPKLVVTYETAAKSVTAIGVTTEEHDIKTTADGTNLKIYVDDVEEDSVALAGASVPPNDSDWIILGDALPYTDYYKYTASDTLAVWYQPVSIIVSSVLPDKEGADQDGTITWGSNPAGVDITLGELVSSSQPQPTGTTGQGGQPDMTGGTGQPGWTGALPTLASNPLYPLVSTVADTTNIPVGIVWIAGATFILLAAMLLCFRYVPHQLITVFVGEGLTIFFWQMGIYPFWTIFLFALGGIAIVLYERMPSV